LTVKKLAVVMIIAIALVGCARESSEVEAQATELKEAAKTLTVAWHKVAEEDGSICELSTATQARVERAVRELRMALAPNGVEIVVETLIPEPVEGGECLCNRVLVQGRFVDEWLSAEVAKASCYGCPDRAGCPKSADAGNRCGGQTTVMYQGKTYEVLPASLIAMAGLIAAADLTGETVTYSGCPGEVCDKCLGPCVGHHSEASAASSTKATCTARGKCGGCSN
jgi:hypothetical protein